MEQQGFEGFNSIMDHSNPELNFDLPFDPKQFLSNQQDDHLEFENSGMQLDQPLELTQFNNQIIAENQPQGEDYDASMYMGNKPFFDASSFGHNQVPYDEGASVSFGWSQAGSNTFQPANTFAQPGPDFGGDHEASSNMAFGNSIDPALMSDFEDGGFQGYAAASPASNTPLTDFTDTFSVPPLSTAATSPAMFSPEPMSHIAGLETPAYTMPAQFAPQPPHLMSKSMLAPFFKGPENTFNNASSWNATNFMPATTSFNTSFSSSIPASAGSSRFPFASAFQEMHQPRSSNVYPAPMSAQLPAFSQQANVTIHATAHSAACFASQTPSPAPVHSYTTATSASQIPHPIPAQVAHQCSGPQVAYAQAELKDGEYSVAALDGRTYPAILFSRVYFQNETQNLTSYPPEHIGWGEDRANRPDILFVFKPDAVFKAKLAEAINEQNRKKSTAIYNASTVAGRILLNKDAFPIRYHAHLPETFSTEVPGWYLEALFRLDPRVKHDDIIDRMPSTGSAIKRNTRTLHQRRARARQSMRISNWNHAVKKNDIWETVIEESLDDWGRNNNSARRLSDLTRKQVTLYEDLVESPKLNPKNKAEVISKMQKTRVRALNAGYDNQHQFIINLDARIAAWTAL